MMYSIYNSDGQIVRILTCNNIQEQLNTGEGYLNGVYDDTKYYIENDKPVLMPVQPAGYYVFNYKTKTWIDPRTNDSQWEQVKAKRNKLLFASDWTQLPDAPQQNKQAWADYRQALRDVTLQTDPFKIVWPTKPE